MDWKDPEQVRQYHIARMRAYRAANPEKARTYHAANRDKRNAQKRAWNKANTEARAAYSRTWHNTNRARFNARMRAWYEAHPEAWHLSGLRRRAARCHVPCTLTLADVRKLLAPMRCSATGLPLARAKGEASTLSPSLDRIIPAIGYVPGNVRLVCQRFNMLRGTDPVSHDYRHALRVLAETSHASDSPLI